MKIAIVDPSLFTIPYDRELVGGLRDNAKEVRWYGRPLRDGESRLLRLEKLEPFFYRWSEGRTLRKFSSLLLKGADHIRSMIAFEREVAHWGADFLHFQWFPLPMVDAFFVRRLSRRCPVIATVHDSTPFNANPSAYVQRLGARNIWMECDHLIVHTASAASSVVTFGVREDRVSVIDHGILPSTDSHLASPVDKKGRVLLVQFGTVKQYKGVDILLKAIAALPDAVRKKVMVSISGKASCDVDELVELRRDLRLEEECVFDFKFYTDEEMYSLLSAADVLVFPYRAIDASGVLLASLPFGRPIIASKLGAFEEMLADGVHGRLVPPNDVEALSLAIEELVCEPEKRSRMGQSVMNLGSKVPSWVDIAAKTLRTYETAQRSWSKRERKGV